MAPKNHPGFFSSGRTVQARDLRYIERQADVELLDHCRNGRSAYILEGLQTGKSSLFAHSIEQLNLSSHHAVLIDLSQFSLPQREEDWFLHIVGILDDRLDLSTDTLAWWTKPAVFALPPFIRLTKLMIEVILPQLNKPLVLFFDEIERIVAVPFLEQFMEWLVGLYESREANSILNRLSFVVCGMAAPSQLISQGQSSFFQWSHRVGLQDFTIQEALLLANGMSLPTNVANEMVTRVYHWTQGHPYLTPLFCQLLEHHHHPGWLVTEADECIRQFIASSQGLREPHFQFIRTALTEVNTNGISFLESYGDLIEGKTENLKANASALEQLELIGLLRKDEEEITIRNLLYQEAFPLAWVTGHLSPQVDTPPSVVPTFSATRYVYAIAASLFLLGLGGLFWFLGGPVSQPLPASAQDGPSGSEEQLREQRTQLETQLASKESALFDLQTRVQDMESALAAQKKAYEQIIDTLQSEQSNLQAKASTTASELNAANDEVRKLQEAVLKKSSFSSSEINKLMAETLQVDAHLKTTKTELAIAQERASKLDALLAQQKQEAEIENHRLTENRTRLETKIKELETAMADTQQALSTQERTVQEQENLARRDITRLEKERLADQEQLRSQQEAIMALENQTQQSEATLSEKEEAIRETQQEIAALTMQAAVLENTVSEKDQNLKNAQQTINGLTSEIKKVREGESQANSRFSQLNLQWAEQTKITDGTLLGLEQERDQLKAQLTLTEQELNTTKTEVASLAGQLAQVQQTTANSQDTIKTIQASSSEKSRQAEKQIAVLTQTNTELETRFRENEEVLHQAQQRIRESEIILSNVSVIEKRMRQIIEERNQLATQLNDTQQQLTKAQGQIQSSEQAPTAESSADKEKSEDGTLSSKADNISPFYQKDGSWKVDLKNITKMGGDEVIQSQGKSGKREEDFILEFKKIIGDTNGP